MKLNEWIEEEIELEVPTVDIDQNGAPYKTISKISAKRRSIYVDPPSRKVVCKRGEHDWYPVDTSKGLFKCSKCNYRRIVEPITYEYFKDDKGGHLRHKKTGLLI